jgi:hypothetical protein
MRGSRKLKVPMRKQHMDGRWQPPTPRPRVAVVAVNGSAPNNNPAKDGPIPRSWQRSVSSRWCLDRDRRWPRRRWRLRDDLDGGWRGSRRLDNGLLRLIRLGRRRRSDRCRGVRRRAKRGVMSRRGPGHVWRGHLLDRGHGALRRRGLGGGKGEITRRRGAREIVSQVRARGGALLTGHSAKDGERGHSE